MVMRLQKHAPSHSLEANGRLLMGRESVSVASELGFFSLDQACECFQVPEKLPVCRERERG